MELCDDDHDQICFDQKNCPACEMLKKISDQDDEIYTLKETIDEMKEATING